MTSTQLEDMEKKQLIYFLEKYKKRMIGMVEENEQTVNKKQSKLKQCEPESISHKKAFKITSKVSESQRNVNYYKNELQLVNQAMDDIAHNRDSYAVNQAKARNELGHIKREMNLILGLSLIIYFMLYMATIMAPIIKSVLPVMMALMTVVGAAFYDMKCKQYNAVQQNEERHIDDTLIAVERPFIFKWFALIFFVVIFAWGIAPYFKWFILPYFTETVAPFVKYIVIPIFKLLIT